MELVNVLCQACANNCSSCGDNWVGCPNFKPLDVMARALNYFHSEEWPSGASRADIPKLAERAEMAALDAYISEKGKDFVVRVLPAQLSALCREVEAQELDCESRFVEPECCVEGGRPFVCVQNEQGLPASVNDALVPEWNRQNWHFRAMRGIRSGVLQGCRMTQVEYAEPHWHYRLFFRLVEETAAGYRHVEFEVDGLTLLPEPAQSRFNTLMDKVLNHGQQES